MLHDTPSAGHLGPNRCVYLLKNSPVYWFKYLKALRLYCKCCDDCLHCKPMQCRERAPMKSFTAGEPMERMAIDIMGELHKSKAGNKCVAVVMDYFT